MSSTSTGSGFRNILSEEKGKKKKSKYDIKRSLARVPGREEWGYVREEKAMGKGGGRDPFIACDGHHKVPDGHRSLASERASSAVHCG